MFEPGNIVQLNSGSCDMTVVSDDAEELSAVWINEDGTVGEITAPSVCFKAAEEEQKFLS
jgi:hypothetical protein